MKSLHKFPVSGEKCKESFKIPPRKSNLLAMETFLRSLEQLIYFYRSHHGVVIDRLWGRT